ncbi:hypothetical protein [Melioribacter sp. OK-6-Me]|uniref:hypothetical protein n=1 Tax=unclassified Melioribacter TaxID=2627329 RepID=UPI003EDA1E9A
MLLRTGIVKTVCSIPYQNLSLKDRLDMLGVTPKEVARIVGCGTTCAYKNIKSGKGWYYSQIVNLVNLLERMK